MTPVVRRSHVSRVVGAVLLAALVTPAVASGASALPTPRPGSTTTQIVTISPTVRAGASTWARKTPRPAPIKVDAGDPAAAEVVRLVNLARATAGCGALRVDSRLTTAARLHSEDMALRNYFSHTSLDGRSPWDRIEAQGYTAGSGENIAAGQSTPAAVMDAWMKSTGHRANILSCSNRAIGVGIGRGGSYGTYWTQDFGRE
jgi:uncharacterized protein YkwD